MTLKQLKNRYEQYLNSNYYSVNDFYNNCSTEKRQAQENIKIYMYKNNGRNYKVIGGNCNFFTAGWIQEKNNKKYFIFETYLNRYELEL